MIKASLKDKTSGQVFANITVQRSEQLALYESDTVEVQQGWVADLEMLNAEQVQQNFIRNERNRRLDASAWTIRADSPLTPENQAAWLEYLKTLQRLTVDQPDSATLFGLKSLGMFMPELALEWVPPGQHTAADMEFVLDADGAQPVPDRIPLEEISEAYHIFSAKRDHCIKPILIPSAA